MKFSLRDARKRSVSARRRDMPNAPLALPIPVAGFVAAMWAHILALGSLIALFSVMWVITADPDSTFSAAMTVAVLTYGLAHGASLTVAGLTLGLAPLALTLIIAVFSVRAFKGAFRLSRTISLGSLIGLLFSYSLSYSLMLDILLFASAGNIPANYSRTALTAFGFAFAVGIFAITRSPGVVVDHEPHTFTGPGQRTEPRIKIRSPHEIAVTTWRSLPHLIRWSLITALRTQIFLTMISAVIFVGLLIWRNAEIAAVINSLTANSVGSVSLWMLNGAFAPVIVLWISSVLWGSGFYLGTNVAYSVTNASLGPLPSMPLLAVIPPTWNFDGRILFVLTLIAATLPYLSYLRAISRISTPVTGAVVVMKVFLTSLFAGVFAAALALVAAGGIGGGRFSLVGPESLATGLYASAWSLLGGLVFIVIWAFRQK